MLERTGKRKGRGEGGDERNCNEDAAGEKQAESKRSSTGQRLKGKEKTFIEREPRPYPALLFTWITRCAGIGGCSIRFRSFASPFYRK